VLIHEIPLSECVWLLKRTSLGRLACARGNQPYIVPISFQFDADQNCLYSFSTLGQKIDWMRENPKVCVEVDEIADRFEWTTVVIFGRYEEIRDNAQDRSARVRAHELFQTQPVWWMPGAGKLAGTDEHHTPVIYRISIERMTGRRVARGGE
jgi:nitroimidazol reductase NimA-like FMN-containing flavoprotein (pyridoxamine 5'-phosphate oxidase superfamily)